MRTAQQEQTPTQSWFVGQTLSFQHGPDATNIFTHEVTELDTNGKPSRLRLVVNSPKQAQ